MKNKNEGQQSDHGRNDATKFCLRFIIIYEKEDAS